MKIYKTIISLILSIIIIFSPVLSISVLAVEQTLEDSNIVMFPEYGKIRIHGNFNSDYNESDYDMPRYINMYINDEKIGKAKPVSGTTGDAIPGFDIDIKGECWAMPKPQKIMWQYNGYVYGYPKSTIRYQAYYDDGTTKLIGSSQDLYLLVGLKKGMYIQDEEDLEDLCTWEPVMRFSDIEESVFEEYIRGVYLFRIAEGYDDMTYRPNEVVTRGAMAKFIVNAFGFKNLKKGTYFPDVRTNHTFFKYIQTLKSMGIVNGYSDGEFKPEEPVTRGAVTKFVIRAMMENGLNRSTDRISHEFKDVEEENVFSEYIGYLSKLKVNGERVIKGFSDDTFRPDESLTRGQMAKIIDLARQIQFSQDTDMCVINNGIWVSDYQECEGISNKVCGYLQGNYVGKAFLCRHSSEYCKEETSVCMFD